MKAPRYVLSGEEHYPGNWFLFDTYAGMRGLLPVGSTLWNWPESKINERWRHIPQSDLGGFSGSLGRAIGGVGGNAVKARLWAMKFLEGGSVLEEGIREDIFRHQTPQGGMILIHAVGRGSGAGMSAPFADFIFQKVLGGSSNLNLDIAVMGDRKIPDEMVYPTAAVYSLHYLLNSSAIHSILLVDNGLIKEHVEKVLQYDLKRRSTYECINAFLHEALMPLWVNLSHNEFFVPGVWRKNPDIADVRSALLQYQDSPDPKPTLSALGFARLPMHKVSDMSYEPERVLKDLVDEALRTVSIEVKREPKKPGEREGKIVARSYYAFLTAPPEFYSRVLNNQQKALVAMVNYLSSKLWWPLSQVRGELGPLKFARAEDLRLTVLLSGIEPKLLDEIAREGGLEEDTDGPKIAEVIRNLDEEQVVEMVAGLHWGRGA
jgi:hypothetical protein